MLALLASGDEVVCSAAVYGGVYHFANDVLPRYGITPRFVRPEQLANPAAVLKSLLRMVKPTGRICLVEYRLLGDTAKHIKAEHRMSVKQVLADVAAAYRAELKSLGDAGVPHMIFINKIDRLEGSLGDTIAALQALVGPRRLLLLTLVILCILLFPIMGLSIGSSLATGSRPHLRLLTYNVDSGNRGVEKLVQQIAVAVFDVDEIESCLARDHGRRHHEFLAALGLLRRDSEHLVALALHRLAHSPSARSTAAGV